GLPYRNRYGYRRDDDAGLWSSADLTYVITYEM
ncbi:phage tail terminator protein, partial [Escherichia sp. HC-TM1]